MPKFVKDEGKWKRNQTLWPKHWNETNDIRYAALAIGRAVSISSISGKKLGPPEWALNACRDYFENYDSLHFDPLKPKSSGSPGISADDQLLDEMAHLIHFSGETINAAARSVTGEGSESSNVRRLTRKWKDEWGDCSKEFKEDNLHPRILVLLRRTNSFLFPFQS